LIDPKKVIAGTKIDLMFEITNHNNYPLEQVEFEIIDSNIESSPIILEEIQKLQRETIQIKSRCLKNADVSAINMHMRVIYRFIGQVHEQLADVAVTYDTLMKTKFDLRDL